jgi:phenylpropionate dioxygenase-like ring-hydroxylating dioxygenase large terminal subunit
MQLPSTSLLTRRVLAHFDAKTLDLADEAVVASSEVFTSVDRHAADVAMMRRVPHVVAWAGEIPGPGDYATTDVAGTSVLLVRGSEGRVRAFVNACAHRGAQIVAGSGHANRFSCPYHAWTYDGEGCLVGVPSREMFDGVDLSGLGLRSLPVSEQVGLVVVGLDDDVVVDGFLGDLEPELSEYPYRSYAHAETAVFHLQTNWKLAVDVNFEGYHFPFLHKVTLGPYCRNYSVFDTFGRHCRWAFPLVQIDELRHVPEDSWPDRFVGTVVYGLFPSCVLIESATATQMLRVYPGAAPGECELYLSQGSFGPIVGDEQMQRCIQGLEAACQVLRDEDFPAAEGCQRGVEAGIEQIIVGRNEPLLQHLHHTWDDAVADRG